MMSPKRMPVIVLLLCATALLAASGGAADDQREAIRFVPVEVWIDTGGTPLATYQIDIAATTEGVTIVGIEGGEHELFREPPYYDARAMQSNRVIVGDFSTARAELLPIGRFRVVTLHLQVAGDAQPDFTAVLDVAADADAAPIHGNVTFVLKDAPE